MTTASSFLVVKFLTGRAYTHTVADDREAQHTVEGWQRQGGLWVVDAAARNRVWCPWHTVTEVVMPRPPHSAVIGGRGPAVQGSGRRPAAAPTEPPIVPVPVPPAEGGTPRD